MRFLIPLLICASVSACEAGYEEIREGRTALVYACGDNWPDFLEEDIVAAIDDWNAAAGARFGKDLFAYGGILEDEKSFEDSDIGDGRHCIYRVTSETATSATRELKEENPKAAALFVRDDDIVIWSGLTGEHLERWALQAIVAHELGHGAGLDHVEEDDPVKSVMKSKRHTMLVQAFDVERFCAISDCL